jgi:hypothetical protein
MKVLVRTSGHPAQEFDISHKAQVRDLKYLIGSKLIISYEKQKLSFHGNMLKNNEFLEKHNMANGSTFSLESG